MAPLNRVRGLNVPKAATSVAESHRKPRVECERAGGVVYLWLTPPARKNVLDRSLDNELCRHAEDLAFDDTVRVVVLAARSGDFCLGANGLEASAAPLASIEAVAALPCPVVAVIDGGAVAEGCELALAADLRLASSRAYFALPQVLRGSMPRHGATQRLPRLVGRMRALEMLWTGRRVAAREAAAWGLVNAVHSPKKLFSAARELARRVASCAPLAVRYAKEAVTRGLESTLEQGMRLEEDLYVLLQTTTDWRIGIDGFRQKKAVSFVGK